MTEQRKCPECGEKIIGRADKKFCSDECRNNYNNRQNSDATNLIRNTNNILRKNRRILEELAPEGKAKVHKNKLNEKGFNYSYFTTLYKTQKGSVYYYCYDYGYLPLEHDFYLVVCNTKNNEQAGAGTN
jgi:predicted nucleic acid-binding Zn ribbon protein